jgi:hypothetical protein
MWTLSQHYASYVSNCFILVTSCHFPLYREITWTCLPRFGLAKYQLLKEYVKRRSYTVAIFLSIPKRAFFGRKFFPRNILLTLYPHPYKTKLNSKSHIFLTPDTNFLQRKMLNNSRSSYVQFSHWLSLLGLRQSPPHELLKLCFIIKSKAAVGCQHSYFLLGKVHIRIWTGNQLPWDFWHSASLLTNAGISKEI